MFVCGHGIARFLANSHIISLKIINTLLFVTVFYDFRAPDESLGGPWEALWNPLEPLGGPLGALGVFWAVPGGCLGTTFFSFWGGEFAHGIMKY